MELDEITARIAECTGIPAELLDGKTPEENIAKARVLLDYRAASGTPQADKQRSTKELFKAWLETTYRDNQDAQDQEPAILELNKIAEELRIANGGYPVLEDGGGVNQVDQSDSRPTSEKFAEWFYGETAFNPRKDRDGWILLT